MPAPFDALVVTVMSPDANIEATIDSGYQVRLGFRRGTYQRYDESTLAHQLGQLGRLAWAAYQRERRVVAERSGLLASDADPRRRRYRQDLQQLEAAGTSAGGAVALTSTGLERWTCAIQPGTLARLTEAQLAAEVEGAVADLVADYHHRAVLLKDDCFGFDLPSAVRSRIDRMGVR